MHLSESWNPERMAWKRFFWTIGFDTFAGSEMSFVARMCLVTQIPLWLFVLPLVGFALSNLDDVDTATLTVLPAVTDLLCSTKFLVFVHNRRALPRMIAIIEQLLVSETRNNWELGEVVAEQKRRNSFFSTVYGVSVNMTAALAAFLPFVIMAVDFARGGRVVTLVLPFPGWYPYDEQDPKWYVFTYIWDAVSIHCAASAAIMVDTLFIAFTYHICALLKVLQRQMQCVDNVASTPRIFAVHQTMLQIMDELNSMFQPVVCAQLLISSVQLCMICFQLERHQGEPDAMLYLVYGPSILIQVFIYCYCGELISTESQAFAGAIYDSPWYKLDPRTARTFILPMARAQKAYRLNGYFFGADLMTYTAMIKTAMSYTALLRSIEQ